MNVLLIGCLYSEEKKLMILDNSRRGYQFAAQNFQESIVEGFLMNDVQLSVLSIPSLSTFPIGSNIPFVKDSPFVYKGNVIGKTVGYVNFPFLNHTNKRKTATIVDDWYEKAEGPKNIVVYALLLQQMSIAVEAKKRHPDIKICVIVPDLPQYMGCNRIFRLLGLQKKSINKINSLIPLFDCYTVLTETMIEMLNCSNKPYIVVEGIYSRGLVEMPVYQTNTEEKIILYTGGLVFRYGIGDLVQAFMKIIDSDYRLWLCGTGDAVPYIKECASHDERIVYKGMLPKEEILKLQQEATLLVNPRHSNEEYTKYSFPSKTMEYLASGKPTIMSHLKCIPTDYEEYLYYFDDESVDGMANRMKTICDMDKDGLKERGNRSTEFIKTKKNPQVQVGKIYELLIHL